MARTVFPYKVQNRFRQYVDVYRGHKMAQERRDVTKQEVMEEIAKYCRVTANGLNMIWRGINTPSLPLALKIAEFFECRVEDIFFLLPEGNQPNYGAESEVEYVRDGDAN